MNKMCLSRLLDLCKDAGPGLAGILLFSFLLPAIQAQEIERSTSTIRVTTRLVLLDASVVDAKGKPVEGLTSQDFEVLEDDHPQKIASFDASRERLLPELSHRKGVTLDVTRPRQFGRAPVDMFVLDEMNTHFADASFAVRSLRAYLTKQPELMPRAAALFTVTNSGFQLLQSYTADRDLLLRALDAHKIVYAWKLEGAKSVGSQVVDRLDISLSAMEQIAQNAAALPGHKNLIWIGAGFPTLDPDALSKTMEKLLRDTMQHVTDELLDARISLYAVDPTSNAAGLTEITSESQLAFTAAAGDSTARLSEPFDKSLDFDRLAPVSGGRVIRGLNDVDRQIDLSVRLASSYYTLGYQPQGSEADEPRFRKIRIVCKRPGATVLSREGYYASPPTALVAGKDVVQSDLNIAAAAAVPFSALSVRVEGSGGSYVVHVQSSGLSWHPVEDGEQSAQVQVMAVALSASNAVRGHRLQSMTAHSTATLDAAGGNRDAAFKIEFTTPPKTRTLRFVVRDAATGHMGTADLVIDQK
jgi:VWFA-related protein